MNRSNRAYSKKRMSLAIAAAFSLSTAAFASASDERVQLDIKSQQATPALLELSKKTGSLIVVEPGVGSGFSLPAINGELSLTEALDKLLTGSGLSYQITNDGSVVVSKEDEKLQDSGRKKATEEVEEIVVTGSRIRNAKPTSNMVVLTRDDLDRLGVNTAADIIATLPQNDNRINIGATTLNGGDSETPYGSLGEASANLRGVGAEGTLVLVDGRRLSGSPAFAADGRVNLGTIPAASIERVEVLLDGASAIYGSDAIGGVINFIMKKDYVGANTQVRYENSAHDADNYTLTQTLGYSWGSGSVLGTVSYGETDGVSTYHAGWTTNDYREFSPTGSDRRELGGQPGIVWYVRDAEGNYINNPEGTRFWRNRVSEEAYDKDTWTVDDIDFLGSSYLYDLFDQGIPTAQDEYGLYYDEPAMGLVGTPETKNKSVTLKLEQDITENLSVYADTLWMNSTNLANRGPMAYSGWVPASNPYNKFGTEAYVGSYLFLNEFQSGAMQGKSSSRENERLNYTFGAKFDSNWKDWLFDFSYSHGESEGSYETYWDITWDGYQDPVNEGLVSAIYGIKMEVVDPEADRKEYVPVLDGDGNTISVPAINFFTDEGNDPDLEWSDFIIPTGGYSPKTLNDSYEISGDGELFEIPGGVVRMATNISYRKENLDWSKAATIASIRNATKENMDREVYAAGVEFQIPLISEENRIPGVESLIFSLAGRYEDYQFEGDFYDDGNIGKKSFDRISPRYAFSWKPTSETMLQGSWGQSFRAPQLEWLYAGVTQYDYREGGDNEGDTRTDYTHPFLAPEFYDQRDSIEGYEDYYRWLSGSEYADDRYNGLPYQSCEDYYGVGSSTCVGYEDYVRVNAGRVRYGGMLLESGGNPDLKPEIATNRSLSFTYEPEFLEGFKVRLSWADIEWENRLMRLSYSNAVVNKYYWLFPDIIQRDSETGNLIYGASRPINAAYRRNESLDLDLSYQFSNDYGFWDFSIYAVETLHQEDQLISEVPVTELVGGRYGSDKYRVRAKAAWSGENMGATLFANWRSGYYLVDSNLNQLRDQWMPHATTYDLTGYYDFVDYGARVNVGIRNVLNRKWDFIDDLRAPYDATRYDARGRMIYMEVSKEFDL